MAQLTQEILNEFEFLLQDGYVYEHLFEKSSDRSAVIIHRFRRGRDFYDFRILTDGKERNFVMYCDGAYRFPSLEKKHKKISRAFYRKHFFRKPTEQELWQYAALLLKEEIK